MQEQILPGLGCPGAQQPLFGPALTKGCHGQGSGGEESCGAGRYTAGVKLLKGTILNYFPHKLIKGFT